MTPVDFALLDDLVVVEYGRVLNDGNYGNFRLTVRIETRNHDLDKVIKGLKEYVDSKMEEFH